MEISLIIPYIIFLVCSVFIYIKVFPLFCTVEDFCNKLLSPVDRLCDLFSSRKSSFSNNLRIRLIITIGVFVASVGYIVISFFSAVNYVELITSFLGGSALFGLIDFTTIVYESKDGNVYAAIISIGITSFLSFLYMRCTVETLEETNLPKVVKVFLLVLFNILFTFISFFLSETLVQMCSAVGTYMINIFHRLAAFFTTRGHSLWEFLKIIFIGFIFLGLLYAAFNAFVITFREILATFMYGAFAIVLLFAISMPILMIPNFPAAITSFLSTICLLIPDYIRANEKAKDSFIRFIDHLGRSRH